MAKKVFVSYKYADGDVEPLQNYYFTTVRDYVTKFQEKAYAQGIVINKGEKDDEDLSHLSEDTIWKKLKDRIYDSTVTVVFISPNMKEPYKLDKNQWIPWEISFSLREQPRNGRTSHANSLIFVILPNKRGTYEYYRYMSHFNIVAENIKNQYGVVVQWNYFIRDIEKYIELAESQKEIMKTSNAVKQI